MVRRSTQQHWLHEPAAGMVQLETDNGAFPLNSSIAGLSIAKVWGSAESGSIALFSMWD